MVYCSIAAFELCTVQLQPFCNRCRVTRRLSFLLTKLDHEEAVMSLPRAGDSSDNKNETRKPSENRLTVGLHQMEEYFAGKFGSRAATANAAVDALPHLAIVRAEQSCTPSGSDCVDITTYSDSAYKVQQENGVGFFVHQADGAATTTHWGPQPKDNYTTSDYADGSYKRQYLNGSGFTRQPQADGSIDEHHWGRDPVQNFDKVEYANGDFRIERADQKGYTHNHTAAGGYKEHHWGPDVEDNFDQVRRIDAVTGNATFAKKIGRLYEELIPAADRRILDASGVYALQKPTEQNVQDDAADPAQYTVSFDLPNDIQGINIGTPHKMADLHPADAKQVMYNDGGTLDNCRGYFDSGEAATFFAHEPHRMNRTSDATAYIGEIYKFEHSWAKNDPRSTVAHEVGHAIDHSLYDVSSSSEFSAAYDQDVRSIPPSQRSSLDYYLPQGQIGGIDSARKEAFAEIYANIRGEASKVNPIESYFPRSTAVVKEKLADLAKADTEHISDDE
jgi:hypothetical protein